MRLFIAIPAFALAACSQTATESTESWECNHRGPNDEPMISEWTVDGDFLASIQKGPTTTNDAAVVTNTQFNDAHRVLRNDDLGLIAVLSVASKDPVGKIYVGTETLLINKETGESQMTWASTDPANNRAPSYGTCRRLK